MNETDKNMNTTEETVDKTVFPQYTQPYKEPESEKDSGSVFLGILSFLQPMAGLIAYLAVKCASPKRAKSALIGALLGLALSLITVMISAGAMIGSITSLIEMAGGFGQTQGMWDVSETYETVEREWKITA
ncbi:MAG: hypothetical protein IJ302_05775 [Clostridia bacterium]|nr:hypothetical protein [Clostridia bacterium]